MLLVHGPEWLDRPAGGEHDLLRAAGVSLHKLGDVVDATLIGHPDAACKVAMLCHFLCSVLCLLSRSLCLGIRRARVEQLQHRRTACCCGDARRRPCRAARAPTTATTTAPSRRAMLLPQLALLLLLLQCQHMGQRKPSLVWRPRPHLRCRRQHWPCRHWAGPHAMAGSRRYHLCRICTAHAWRSHSGERDRGWYALKEIAKLHGGSRRRCGLGRRSHQRPQAVACRRDRARGCGKDCHYRGVAVICASLRNGP
mmetsp:Transcript_578/g.1565  ORF Transcript_578/g.1565 Transcript_578/m.1565 type:complete len:254 (+) Transcript_578:1463-2224(+)